MATASWTSRSRFTWTAAALVALLVAGGALRASAEDAWVRGEVRLNLRTGPGLQYRIVGVISTGDKVRVVDRTEEWTKIQLSDGKDGWIPEGYLQTEPPAAVRADRLDAEVAELKARLEETSADATRLREANEQIGGRDQDQREEIERLTLENYELRAGARWPEWITGASILVVGMMVGALLHRNATRRPTTRIRI